MITINNLEEMKKYYDKQTNTYVFYDDVEFTIDIDVESDINAQNIDARDINARDINARDIDASDIKAKNIDAWDIDALDIDAYDIKAQNIKACDINAWNIYYHYFCIAYYTFKCKSVSSDRVNSICKCLDKEIEYIK